VQTFLGGLAAPARAELAGEAADESDDDDGGEGKDANQR
jgi:hypothetical protein